MKKQMKASWALTAILTLFGASAMAQQQDTVRTLDEVLILSSRADNKTPLTTSTMSREQLQENKIAAALPYMLELEPSVVTTSENGMVGVTNLRIRGVDATRINVNINGITLNDAESQSVYWYNIPNLGGMSQSVQLQRGVGASNGGSAALGGAMNLQTLNTASKPYGAADLSWGSFNTRQYGLMAGTGLTRHGLSFDVAYNGLTSDGFQRGGQTDQQSLFFSASRYTERSVLKLIGIIGEQHSGITWDGASADDLDADPHYNGRGKIKDAAGHFLGYYNNETDNYYQQHAQLYYSRLLNSYWTLNAALDYTHGYGYTESYKNGKKASSYGVDTLARGFNLGNLIYRKLMFNNAYTANLSARYEKEALTLTFGASYLFYDGKHYGNVIWFENDTASATPYSKDNPFDNWYDNTGRKHDLTVYAKANYEFSDRFNLYADIQGRFIKYGLHGTDDDYGQIDYDTTHLFFNPKLGVNYLLSTNQHIYAVAGVANREPARADIKEAVAYSKEIKSEQMLDVELGYQLGRKDFSFNANLYAMLYKDQLTPNGLITESGYSLMENVEKSYRMGLELVAGYRFDRHFSLDGNLTLSLNKAIDYEADLMAPDWSGYNTYSFGTTDLALSPSVVGAAIFTYKPVDRCKLQLIGKYVGDQYADNTGRDESKLDAYFLLNARASYTISLHNGNEIECQMAVNNILDHNYRTTAWCGVYYDPVSGDLSTDRGFFQQPGINVMGRVVYRF